MASVEKPNTVWRNTSYCRLKDPATGDYLHMSAQSTVRGTTYAWSGTQEQARTLARRAAARNEPFNFTIVPLTDSREQDQRIIHRKAAT